MIRFRQARREDVATIVALLRDDALGAARETEDLTSYLAMFDCMSANPMLRLVVGEDEAGSVIACYQIAFLDGLSLRAARRAQIEGVRVARELRGRGIGAVLMEDAEARARAEGCRLMQLTSDASRKRAHEFYMRLGYEPSHIGFKRLLD